MSSIGTGYDLSASQFSPDGRIFQVEFAQKAVANSGTAIGLRGKNGVVFAVKKPVTSKLYEAGANKRIFTIDRHVGVAVAGLIADARQVVETAKSEAATYRSDYNDAIPLNYLKDRVAMHMHAYTLYSSLRPYGASVILGAYEYDGPQMYCIDPSGTAWGYYGCAIGKAKQEAKKQMEFLQLKDLTIDQLVKEAAKIIYNVQNEINDRNFELELSWVGEITNGKHVFVPKNVFEEAEKYAVESDDSDEEDLDSSWSSH